MAPALLQAGIAAAFISFSLVDAAAVAEPKWYTSTKYYTAPDGGYYTSTQYYISKKYYTPPAEWPGQVTGSPTHVTASALGHAASSSSLAAASSRATSSSSAAQSSSSTSLPGKNKPTSGSNPSSCPQIASTLASTLKSDFSGCNDLARSSIRFAFHDAAGYSSTNTPYAPASGGADGSLLLNDDEISRNTEAPMKEKYRDPYLLPLYQKYKSQGVGAADLAQFAGAVGIKSCSGGPTIRAVVGRTDSSTAAPLPPGSSQDSDPTEWDNHYYTQTQSRNTPGVYSFDSDVNLSNATTECGKAFTDFGENQATWISEFSAAMEKLSVLGIDQGTISGFADCTSLISWSRPMDDCRLAIQLLVQCLERSR